MTNLDSKLVSLQERDGYDLSSALSPRPTSTYKFGSITHNECAIICISVERVFGTPVPILVRTPVDNHGLR